MNSKTAMITTSKNFQVSVNIAFDFDNPKKIEGFIPTSESIKIIDEEILNSIKNSSAENINSRAEILIGPYGKGKSYIVLEMLSLLYNNPDLKNVFTNLAEKIREKNSEVAENIIQYVKSKRRLLPIIINGNSQSLSQSFLYALHLALKKKEFENLMPETHFEAAAKMIEKWEEEYPETIKKFNSLASVKAAQFKRSLLNYDSESFEEFEKLYPVLTSGSEFNPFAGFDVVDVYEKVCKKLCETGKYDGIFVVYDEFGKYLESSISHATVKDTKLLQDFAERCDRSEKNQMHLLLICHKEIENYIDVLPKQKVDGWKGVSERFRHVHLYNSFSEIYSLISAAIIKNSEQWKKFCIKNKSQFENLQNIWFGNGFRIFSDLDEETKNSILYGCYPLHPATSYILPRLSEKVAQNERTLFTFLSGNDKNGLSSLLEKIVEQKFICNGKIQFLTPDVLFDYFENQMQNEPYTSEIKKYYLAAISSLRSVKKNSLESKIIKTLALIYSLNQFERLSPDLNLLFELFDNVGFTKEAVLLAVKNLSEKFGAVYLNVHNNYLQLKLNSNVDVPLLIKNTVEKRRNIVQVVDVLNNFNTQKFIYPSLYNIKTKITRYFNFSFISQSEFLKNEGKKLERISDKNNTAADGNIFAIFNETQNDSKNFDSEKIIKLAQKISSSTKNVFFIISKIEENFSEKLRQFEAVSFLKNQLVKDSEDSILYDEYEMVFQDLYEVVKQIVNSYIQPELKLATYISLGKEQKLYRKSDLTNLASKICFEIFYRTPVVNNEMLNKNHLTGAGTKSRAKLIDAILTSPFGDLGLKGSGQEVSFMRSSLVIPGILERTSDGFLEKKTFNFSPKTANAKNDENLLNVFSVINGFFNQAEENEKPFTELFDLLVNPENGYGLRLGIIPIYIATVISSKIKNVLLKKNGKEVLVNAQSLSEIADEPQSFSVRVQKWNDEKDNYIHSLENIFCDYLIDDEKKSSGYSYLTNAMFRWNRSLPKYSKQIKKIFIGEKKDSEEFDFNFDFVEKSFSKFQNILKQESSGAHEILFEKIPFAFSEKEIGKKLVDSVNKAKCFFDGVLLDFENKIVDQTKINLSKLSARSKIQMSLKNVIAEFCNKLNPKIENQIFENGAHSLFAVYKSCGNDEKQIVSQMSKILTGLSIEDWNDDTVKIFFERLNELNNTFLNFESNSKENFNVQSFKNRNENTLENDCNVSDFKKSFGTGSSDNYEIHFVQNENQTAKIKSFARVECSRRAKSLEEEIWRTVEEMGQSVTNAEKRQVLVSLLEKLC